VKIDVVGLSGKDESSVGVSSSAAKIISALGNSVLVAGICGLVSSAGMVESSVM
jgi:anthranilate phosphoribosyltransferase